ncbi:MAG: PAS domain-containing protein [Thalassobaculum sp.]|uniref:PAS domain-containing protein n=1 Tax=Thalassobaculum sp. TaxID=2022740 RepID=UPI0032EFCBAB
METIIREDLLRRVHAVWAAARAPGTAVPTRRALDLPFSVSFALANIALLDVEEDGGGRRRYRYRLVGEEIIWLLGGNVTGRPVDEVLRGKLRDRIVDILDRCVASRRPDYTVFEFPWESVVRYARYCAPIDGCDGRGVDQILVAVESFVDEAAQATVRSLNDTPV